jgi:hypothetical protein
MSFGFVITRGTKGAIAQAVAAANACILTVDDDAIFTLGIGTDRATLQTGRLVTVVTGQ